MKFSITILLLLGMSFLGHSQYLYWNNAYDLGVESHNYLPQKIILRDTILLSFGSFSFPPSIFARAINMNGEITQSEYYAPGYGFYAGHAGYPAESVLELADKNIIVFESPISPCGKVYPSITKIDANLDTLWHRKYESLIDNNNDCPNAKELLIYGICPLPDTSFMSVGVMRFDNSYIQVAKAIVYIHFDRDGNILNYNETQMTLSDEPPLYFLSGTRYLEQENALLSWGESRPLFPGELYLYQSQILVLKTDMQGNIIDSLHFGSSQLNEFEGSVELVGNDKVILFYQYSTGESTFPEAGVYTEPHVALIDLTDMSVEWEHVYAGLPIYENQVMNSVSYKDALVTMDGKFVSIVQSVHTGEIGYQGVMKVDQQGNLEWLNFYDPDVGGLEALLSIVETPDGGYVATGITYPSETEQKQWAIKIDACGYEEPNGCPPVVSINENEKIEIQIWPNPFHSSLKAILPVNAEWIIITDGTGRRVKQERVYYPHQQWNLSDLENGVYILNVVLEDGRVVARRVVKQ